MNEQEYSLYLGTMDTIDYHTEYVQDTPYESVFHMYNIPHLEEEDYQY